MISRVIVLRTLGSEDWKAWRALRLEALREAPYAFGSTLAEWTGDGDTEARWRDRLAWREAHNVVASIDGTDVGMASGVVADEEGVVGLISMWVAPTGRGRGVGDALVAAVEENARSRGARVLQLMVADGNDAAENLYLRHGFVRTSAQGDLMADGVSRERVMEKPLAP